MKPIPQSRQRTVAAPGSAPIETPVFSKTYDLLRWLVPATLNFPRAQRFVAAAALQEGAQALLRQLLHATPWPALCRRRHAGAAQIQLATSARLATDFARPVRARHPADGRGGAPAGRLAAHTAGTDGGAGGSRNPTTQPTAGRRW